MVLGTIRILWRYFQAVPTCFGSRYSCQLLSLVPAKSLWDCDAQLEEDVEGRIREAGKSVGEKVTGNSPGMGLRKRCWSLNCERTPKQLWGTADLKRRKILVWWNCAVGYVLASQGWLLSDRNKSCNTSIITFCCWSANLGTWVCPRLCSISL